MNSPDYISPASRRWLSITLMVLMAILSIWAAADYPGSLTLFLLYSGITMALVWAMLARPAGFFILFFVSFLTLGCWAKLVFHLILGSRLIEPIGAFDYSSTSWDQALIVMIVVFVTLLVSLAILAILPTTSAPQKAQTRKTPFLGLALIVATLATVALLAFNFNFSILKIGTTPTLQLNSYVYVFVAFMVAWGDAILLATLGFWMVQESRLKPVMLFVLLSAEGCLAAISMGSRAQMILHSAVPLAVYFLLGTRLNWQLTRRNWFAIVSVAMMLFVISIFVVSADRLASFATAIPVQKASVAVPTDVVPLNTQEHTKNSKSLDFEKSTEPVLQPGIELNQLSATAAIPAPVSKEMQIAQWKGVMYELSRLVVDRWIGLEGILTVTAEQNKLNHALLYHGLKEDPSLGAAALYQVMSGSKYEAFENFTFMTIPGPIAVLYYGGNLTIVSAGMAVLLFAGFFIEFVLTNVLKNPMSSGAVGVAMAYLIVQTNFPKALWFFMLELVIFILGLMVLQKLLGLLSRRQT